MQKYKAPKMRTPSQQAMGYHSFGKEMRCDRKPAHAANKIATWPRPVFFFLCRTYLFCTTLGAHSISRIHYSKKQFENKTYRCCDKSRAHSGNRRSHPVTNTIIAQIRHHERFGMIVITNNKRIYYHTPVISKEEIFQLHLNTLAVISFTGKKYNL